MLEVRCMWQCSVCGQYYTSIAYKIADELGCPLVFKVLFSFRWSQILLLNFGKLLLTLAALVT